MFLLSLLKGIPLRVFAYAAILAMVLGASWTAYNKVWTAGYNTAQLELQNASIVAAETAVREAREQWERAASAAEIALLEEKEIAATAEALARRVPEVAASVAPECRNLGPDVLKLYNEAIGE